MVNNQYGGKVLKASLVATNPMPHIKAIKAKALSAMIIFRRLTSDMKFTSILFCAL